MNRAERMLEVLRDGQRHSRRDLWERGGSFYLTNNAASELRAMGYDVEQTRERVNGDVVYFYRLRGSLSEREGTESWHGPSTSRSESEPASGQSVLASSQGDDGKHDHTDGRLEQGSLFDLPARPSWG